MLKNKRRDLIHKMAVLPLGFSLYGGKRQFAATEKIPECALPGAPIKNPPAQAGGW
jgi:hypothetical protein